MSAVYDSKAELLRLHRIDNIIREGEYPSAKKLAEELEVSVRTINRDLDFLRDQYMAPLEYDPQKRGWFYTQKDFFIKYISLKEGEFFSLALMDSLLNQYKNTPLENQLRNIFKKITSSLPQEIIIDSQFLSQDVTFISDALAKIDSHTFDLILACLRNHNILNFEYQPLQKTTQLARSIDPYHLVCQRGNWYVIGYDHFKDDVRIFSLSRIKNAETSGIHFIKPENFDISNYIDSTMGVWLSSKTKLCVRLLFDSSIGTFAAEHIWHEDKTVFTNDDGSVEVSFETTQLPEVKRWVLGQGSTVKVLEPVELIKDIQEEIKKIEKLYKNE